MQAVGCKSTKELGSWVRQMTYMGHLLRSIIPSFATNHLAVDSSGVCNMVYCWKSPQLDGQ